jgi:hypothetical protein
MKKQIINKTPHAIYIVDKAQVIIKVYPKSRGMIRLSEHISEVDVIDGVTITKTSYSKIEDLPKFNKDVYYIVSQLVKNALPERIDFLVPKGIVRDDNGNILGCKYLDRGSI